MITVKKNIDFQKLDSLEIKVPKSNSPYGKTAKRYWVHLAHADVLRVLLPSLTEQGCFWTDDSLKIALSKSVNDMAASVTVSVPNAPDIPNSHFSVGIINSNCQRFQIKLFSGVVMGGVGITLYETNVGKHTLGINLKKRVDEGVERVKNSFWRFPLMLNELESQVVLEPEKLLYKSIHQKISPWGREILPLLRLKRVEKLYRELPPNSLSLLLAVGKIIQSNPPLLQMKQNIEFMYLLQQESVQPLLWSSKR